MQVVIPAALSSPSASASASANTGSHKASAEVRSRIDATAKQFESQFLSVMLGQMFEGTEAAAPFGGGQAEATFKSFMTDAFAKSVTNHGGIGLSKDISKAMLKMQGLS